MVSVDTRPYVLKNPSYTIVHTVTRIHYQHEGIRKLKM